MLPTPLQRFQEVVDTGGLGREGVEIQEPVFQNLLLWYQVVPI